MTSTNWLDIRDEFRSIVFKLGIDEVAERVHASKRTIYRMISDDVERPSGAVVAWAERVIQEEKKR